MKKLMRIATVPGSLKVLLAGQLRYMSEHFDVIAVSSGGKILDELKFSEGVETFEVNMTRQITPIKDFIATIKLYRLMKKEKPYIVHTHTPKAGTLGMLAAKFAGVPHRLHTIAGMPLLEATGSKRKVLNLVEKITYSCSTLILPNSEALKNIIIEEKFCNPEKLVVIGNGSSNGIDVVHFDANKVSAQDKDALRRELDLMTEDTVFIFIGRIVKDKGINELVNAFNDLCKTKSNIKLLILGSYERELDPIDLNSEQIIKQNKNIIETGHIKDIRPYLAISDILTFPSYREGFPNVVLQASCMGKPCIVTDINGCNEIITNNFNGIIIPPKNIRALKDAMILALENPEHLKTMAHNSRQNIINKYRREYVWEEMLKLYTNLEK